MQNVLDSTVAEPNNSAIPTAPSTPPSESASGSSNAPVASNGAHPSLSAVAAYPTNSKFATNHWNIWVDMDLPALAVLERINSLLHNLKDERARIDQTIENVMVHIRRFCDLHDKNTEDAKAMRGELLSMNGRVVELLGQMDGIMEKVVEPYQLGPL